MKKAPPLLPLLAISLAMGCAYSHFLGGVHRRIMTGEMAGAACGGTGWLDCSKTLGGRYSEVMGMPVSVYAEAWFAFLLALLLCGLWRKDQRRMLCRTLFWAIVPGVGITLVYVAISVLILHVLCLYCSGLYFLVGLSAALAFRGMEATPDIAPRIKEFFQEFCRVWALPLALFAIIILWESKLAAPKATLIAQSSPGLPTDTKGGLPRIAPENAVLHITEFSDFECPACRYSARELDRFMARHPGEVALRCVILMSHRGRQTDSVPPGADSLVAQVGAAMQNRGLFWPYYKDIMLSDRIVDETRIWEVVENLVGKDQIPLVRTELGKTDVAAVLERNIAVAQTNKVSQTPSWIINRHLEVGAKTEASWEQLLATARKQPSIASESNATDF